MVVLAGVDYRRRACGVLHLLVGVQAQVFRDPPTPNGATFRKNENGGVTNAIKEFRVFADATILPAIKSSGTPAVNTAAIYNCFR